MEVVLSVDEYEVKGYANAVSIDSCQTGCFMTSVIRLRASKGYDLEDHQNVRYESAADEQKKRN